MSEGEQPVPAMPVRVGVCYNTGGESVVLSSRCVWSAVRTAHMGRSPRFCALVRVARMVATEA